MALALTNDTDRAVSTFFVAGSHVRAVMGGACAKELEFVTHKLKA